MWTQRLAPRNVVIAGVIRRSQVRYHNVVENVMCDHTAIKQTKTAQSLLNKNTRAFWNDERYANKNIMQLEI